MTELFAWEFYMVHLLIVLFVCLSWPAFAQDVNSLDGSVAVSEEAVKDADSLYKNMQAIAADLSEANKKHFFAIYHSHALIGTVETVRDDVGRAIETCGEKNPDLAEPIRKRSDEWTAAVNPILKDATGQVNNMIIAQDYQKPKVLTAFLKDMDVVRAKTSNSLVKVPVTDERACKELLKSMDKTQEDLTELLQESLITIPRSLGDAESADNDSKD